MATVKEMIVILAIAAVIFRLAKPIALKFTTEQDFSRRRNVWFALTAAAFLSPNFWVFAVIAIPLLLWAGRKDTNATALYLLLLHVIPSIPISIPIIGAHGLFDIDNYRLLSFCILIPAALRLRKSRASDRTGPPISMDILLLGWGLLQVAIFVPPDLPDHQLLQDSFTNVVRRAFLFYVDVYVLYFVVSRSCTTRRGFLDALAAFCLSCAVMSSVGLFEFVRHWLLYADLAAKWTADSRLGFYLLRGDVLRAQVSAGHPLALGYLIAIAFGFWLYLQTSIKSSRTRLSVAILYWLGLLAAYSRGPWIGAVVIYFIFAALGRRAFFRLFKSLGIVALVAAGILLSPLGERIIQVLPFMGGSVDSGSTLYRQRLAERSWELILENPFFGDQLAYWKMEDLRQGQGIIDLVNTYAEVALFYGIVGLALFAGFILVGLVKAYGKAKENLASDPNLASLGFVLAACILGTLLMISTCSFIFGYAKMFYVLAGLAAAYTQIRQQPESNTQAQVRPAEIAEPY